MERRGKKGFYGYDFNEETVYLVSVKLSNKNKDKERGSGRNGSDCLQGQLRFGGRESTFFFLRTFNIG